MRLLDPVSRVLTYSIDDSGDTWSIGRKPPAQALTSLLIGPGDGLSGSHNKYEGDASPGRGGKLEDCTK